MLVVGVLYAGGFRYGLVYDDPMLVGGSRITGAVEELGGLLAWDLWESTERAESPTSGYYRPLFLMSLWVDRLLPESLWLWAHRAQDLAWHLAVVGLIAGIARSWGATWFAGLSAAAVFALHPAHVASVQFIAARNDLMATALVLLALRVARTASAMRLGGIIFLCLAAVLSKESAVLVPVLLGFTELTGPAELRRRRALEVFLAATLGVGLALALRAVVGVGFPEGASSHAMSEVLGPALGHWASVVAWPVGLAPGVNLTWPEPVAMGAAAAGCVVVVAIAFGAGRSGAGFMVGAGLLLVPALAGVAGNGLMPDRYLYGPMALGAVAFALALARLPRSMQIGLGMILSALLAWSTARTLPAWQSDATLWRAAVRAHPQPFTWAAYGKALEEAGLLDEAADFIGRAATGAPPMPHACFNTSRIHLRRGQPDAAAAAGQAALDAGCPAVPELLAPMAIGQAASGAWDEAERTASMVGRDPTGQAVLVRCAAAARRGDLGVLSAAALGGGGDPLMLKQQVAWLLRTSGEEAAALAVESAPLEGGASGG